MNILIKILIFISILFSFSSLAYTALSDRPYYKTSIGNNKWNLIISKDFKNSYEPIQSYSKGLLKEYNEFFSDSFYKKNSLVFVSSKLQISNAFVQVYPLPSMFIYPSPFEIMDSFAVNNWALDSLSHEMSHVYQLGRQFLASHVLSYVFPSYLWFIHPNIYMHNFFLEGHATLLESIYGTGGRLFSGWGRAFVFAQMKNPKSLATIFYDRYHPFSSLEKYLHGSYFYAYLMKKYSLSQVSSIFDPSFLKILFPLGFYSTDKLFKQNLNRSFYKLFDEYINFYSKQAKDQKSSSQKARVKSLSASRMNSTETHIMFMISDYKNPPYLVLMDKATKQFQAFEKNMPIGKVFYLNGEYVSAGLGQVDSTSREISLFKQGFSPIQKYNSYQVMDMSRKKVLKADAKKALTSIRLYLNNDFVAAAASSAVMNEKNDVYYFKQNLSKRSLYKNNQELFSYQGYYGYPVEAKGDAVYFIAPVKRGSSLFRYKNNRVERLSYSDVIIDARHISEDEFLVTEIQSESFEYKIISTQARLQRPYLYKYAFNKKTLDEQEISSNQTEYNSLTGLQFREATTYLGLNQEYKTFGISSQIFFRDPLDWNHINLFGFFDRLRQDLNVQYRYKRYRTQASLKYKYYSGLLSFRNSEETNKAFSILKKFNEEQISNLAFKFFDSKKKFSHKLNEFQAQVDHLIFRLEHMKAGFSSSFTWGYLKVDQNQQTPYLDNITSLNFLFSRKYELAFHDYVYLDFNVFHKMSYGLELRNLKRSYGAHLNLGGEVFEDFYIFTMNRWIHQQEQDGPLTPFDFSSGKSLFSFHTLSLAEDIKDFKLTQLSIQKVFNSSFYPPFPFGLKRLAPFMGVSMAYYKKQAHFLHTKILHLFLGMELDLSLNYKATSRLGIGGGYAWSWQNQFQLKDPKLEIGLYLGIGI